MFPAARFVCLVLALAFFGPPALGAPFTAKDMAMLDRASDPHVSPDGRYVAWNVRSTEWAENRGLNALWVLDRQTPKSAPLRLAGEEKTPTTPRWSADSKAIYFLSSRSGSAQVWRVGVDGVSPVQVTSLPMDINFYRLAPDGKSLVVTQDVYPECPTLACSKDKADAKAKEKASGVVYDTTLPRFWDSFEDDRFLNLFAVVLGPGAPSSATPLMKGYRADIPDKPTGTASAFDISPDGKVVVFAARASGSSQGTGAPMAIYLAPSDGSAPPKRLEPNSPTSDANPIISPDGKRVAWLAKTTPTFAPSNARVMIRPLLVGAAKELAIKADLSIEDIAWSSDAKTIFALAEDVGQRRLYRIDAVSGALQPLTTDGHVSEIDVSSKTLVYARDALDSPSQIYEIAPSGGPSRKLSAVGGEALGKVNFSPFEQFAFPGWNGETVYGYVVKPYDFQPGRKYPVAFLIHGGPFGSFGNAWSYRWNPEVWAGMGYAVVMVDFHGSSSYGESFARSILGHWGDRPLEDLQKGWAYALQTYGYLNGEKACALGGSYGGYMVNWIAGSWNAPWKCLVNHDGVFDTRSMAYATDIPGFQLTQDQTITWESAAEVEKFSPAGKVGAWLKPMLVVHSGRDYRVPLDQGIGAYTALQLRGLPSQLLYFPDENHWVLKPQNSVLWYATVEKWMARWLKEEGAPAEAPAAR